MAIPRDDAPFVYPSVLSVLARDHETNWRDAASSEVSRIEGSHADGDTFGDVPAAHAFARVYAAARVEYLETLQGVRDDLVTAARNLALAAEEMRRRDEGAGEAFVALLARWSTPEGFESTRRQEEARTSEPVVDGSQALAELSAPEPGEAAAAPTVADAAGDPADPVMSVAEPPQPPAGEA